MAWNAPALCKAVTITTGTNNYVLSDPSGSAPYRTDAQAVADGSLANGATVTYVARDTTVTGDASFELGYGVYTSSTRTVARTAGNVLDSDAGPGVLKSWGSGQRDFYILGALDGSDIPASAADDFADNINAARTNAANTFDSIQTIERSGLAGLLDLGSDLAGTNDNVGGIRFFGDDSGGNKHFYAQILAKIGSPTNGAERGYITFRVTNTGSNQDLLQLDHDGTLKNPTSGGKYVAFPTGGTVGIVFTTAPAAGFTRVNRAGERVLRFAESGDTVGAQGGSWTVSGLSGSTSVTVGQGNDLLEVEVQSGTGTSFSVQNGTHTHTGNSSAVTTVSQDGNWRPPYRIVCEATFD